MCRALNLNYNILAKSNYKGLSVEYFHRFLNKSVIVVAEERGTNDIFVPASIVAGYPWNNTPIDGTENIRSIPVIGRELYFPLDINFTVTKLTQNNAHVVL